MKPGDVVFALMPGADTELKARPSIVLKVIPPFDDLMVCGVTSRLRNYTPLLDELILSTDDDFASSGLEKDSMIRLGYIITYPKWQLDEPVGRISEQRLKRLLERLSKFLLQ
jgi:mRNA interferase MazF